MKKYLLLLLVLALSLGTLNSQTELLSNGSFETGDLTDWNLDTINGIDGGPASCAENWRVQGGSLDLCCCVADVSPTDGTSAAYTSFDTTVLDTQWILEQTVTIPLDITAAEVSFDFIAEFDFSLGVPITIDRELMVDLYDTGGVLIGNVFNDQFSGAGTLSVDYSQNIDVLAMLTGLEGTDMVLRFTALIPETQTGPGKALVDNASFLVTETLGVSDNILNAQLSVSPNPSSGVFSLNYGGNESLSEAKIFDINGRLVHTVDLSKMTNEMQIRTQLTSGIYLLTVTSTSNKATKKLIVR